MKKIRKRFHFYGMVQGVGFRYRAEQIAVMYRLTGFVHNCYDGSVEMEIQGTNLEISKVIETLMTSNYISIDRIEEKEIPLSEDERGFRVR